MKLNILLLATILILTPLSAHNFILASNLSREVISATPTPKTPPQPQISTNLTPTKTIRAVVTGYSAEVGQTDDRPTEMASGRMTYIGAIACPNMLNFGDRVEIDGKIYICEDRMNKRFRNKWHFDILFSDRQSALNFGKQTKTILIYSI